MNHRMALQRLDFERRTIPDVDVNLETTPYVVRAISKWKRIDYEMPKGEPVPHGEPIHAAPKGQGVSRDRRLVKSGK